MKKIIRGKMYNTETAKKIATISGGGSSTSLSYNEETLYKKETGEFYLGLCVNRFSKDGSARVNTSTVVITPLSEKEAKEWAENIMSVEDYEETYGTVEE